MRMRFFRLQEDDRIARELAAYDSPHRAERLRELMKRLVVLEFKYGIHPNTTIEKPQYVSETYRELENSLHEVSKCVGRTGFPESSRRPGESCSPKPISPRLGPFVGCMKYGRFTWNSNARLVSSNALQQSAFFRISGTDQRKRSSHREAAGRHFVRFMAPFGSGRSAIPADRSPPDFSVISSIQVQCERAELLPAILKMDRRLPAAVRVECRQLRNS